MRKAGGMVGLAPATIIGLAVLGGCGPGQGGGRAQLTPAQTCLQSLDPATGVDACRTALQTSPDDMALRKRLALLRLKGGSLASARQAYQIVLAQAPGDTEAEFGLGLALETSGQQDGALKKLDAATRNPSVIDTFRKYGFSPLELMTFDTPPLVVGGQSPDEDKAMIPKRALTSALTVNVRCQAGLNGKLHDCAAISQVPPDKADFAEAAKKIFSTTKVRPARNKGMPVADAPIVLTYVFWPNQT